MLSERRTGRGNWEKDFPRTLPSPCHVVNHPWPGSAAEGPPPRPAKLDTGCCYGRAMSRTDSASRVVAVPPDRAYGALVDPDALLTWLPPAGMSGRFERYDLR